MRKLLKAFKEISGASKAVLVIFGISILGCLGFFVPLVFFGWVYIIIMVVVLLFEVLKAFDEFLTKYRSL